MQISVCRTSRICSVRSATLGRELAVFGFPHRTDTGSVRSATLGSESVVFGLLHHLQCGKPIDTHLCGGGGGEAFIEACVDRFAAPLSTGELSDVCPPALLLDDCRCTVSRGESAAHSNSRLVDCVEPLKLLTS